MRKIACITAALAAAFAVGSAPAPAQAADVIITPLGTHTGEFCNRDRALVFEDPDGTRILYDAGRSVLGGTDPRLGDIDVVLLSSVHSDHLGDAVPAALNTGPCGAVPTPVDKRPLSNTAEIAIAKGATIVVGGEMHNFLTSKGAATQILRHGGKRVHGGVTIAVVAAHHSNGVDRGFLDPALAASLLPDNLTAYVGPENGYVLTFSNGLVVYLSGDTGQTADMAAVVRDYYEATVAVVNMGDIFSMGPEEAAFAVNSLLKPKTVIPSHANEEATVGGAIKAGSKVETFDNLVRRSKVIVPLSGVPISCDGKGRCTQ